MFQNMRSEWCIFNTQSSGICLALFLSLQEGRSKSILRDVFIAHVPVRGLFLPNFCLQSTVLIFNVNIPCRSRMGTSDKNVYTRA
jgi:hypothetical protein